MVPRRREGPLPIARQDGIRDCDVLVQRRQNPGGVAPLEQTERDTDAQADARVQLLEHSVPGTAHDRRVQAIAERFRLSDSGRIEVAAFPQSAQ
jgi:hypothetical protein